MIEDLINFDYEFDVSFFTYGPNDKVTSVFKILTELAGVWIMLFLSVAVLLYLIWRRDFYRAVWATMLIGMSQAVFHGILKPWINRPRPTGILILENDSSFPSGHTFAAVLFVYLCLLLWEDKLKTKTQKTLFGFLAAFYVLAIMLSRLILHAHFVSDVVASLVLGILWGTLCLFLFHKFKK